MSVKKYIIYCGYHFLIGLVYILTTAKRIIERSAEQCIGSTTEQVLDSPKRT